MNFLEKKKSPTIPMNEKSFSQNCTYGNERSMVSDDFEAMNVNGEENNVRLPMIIR